MSGLCSGRVVIVTGAGRGIGRCHALAFAREGASVVVNDLGGEVDGTGASRGPAAAVVEEIEASGGRAVVNGDDVSDWQGAQRLVNAAIDSFGKLDVLVNNAGILRDRVLVNMTEEEWDAVIKVHLKGTFAPSHFAAAYWRQQAKQGEAVDARIINTSSGSGLFGNPGQCNYGAAKAGIAAFTIITARELERYGVTVNAIAPGARTRMTEGLGFGGPPPEDGAFDPFAPEQVSPIVVWLGSDRSRGITGRVFGVSGGWLNVHEGWRRGPGVKTDGPWDLDALDGAVRQLIDQAEPATRLFGS